ncbi:MAG: hypothetical protein R2729_05335 [Bryobacteraceae bacterium]
MQDTRSAEPRWPGAAAVVAVAVLNWLLPPDLRAGPGWVAVAAVILLEGAALILRRRHGVLGYSAAAIATAGLGFALGILILDLMTHRGTPADLLRAALLLWSMNIILFASWYWRLDGGGPHGRFGKEGYCGGAFLFPQLTLPPHVRREIRDEGWQPAFVDYLFLAFNTSTAFSPTDVPVLSRWAKVLMMIQASISLATLAMVAARAVNIL